MKFVEDIDIPGVLDGAFVSYLYVEATEGLEIIDCYILYKDRYGCKHKFDSLESLAFFIAEQKFDKMAEERRGQYDYQDNL